MDGIVAGGVVMALAWGVAVAVVHARRRWSRPRPVVWPIALDPLRVVVVAAFHEATARGHDELGHVHVALSLTFDPHVAARLAHIGPVEDLRVRLEEVLDRRDGDPPAEPPGVYDHDDPAIRGYADALRGDETRRSPAGYLGVLLRALDDDPALAPDVHAAFGAFGCTWLAWRATVDAAAPAAPALASIDYRGRVPASRTDCFVRLRDDEETTQALVVEILAGTFGLRPAEARDAMVRIHLLGSATLGPYTRTEAEELAEAATTRARAADAALVVEVEPPRDGQVARPFWRWLGLRLDQRDP